MSVTKESLEFVIPARMDFPRFLFLPLELES